MDEVYQTIHSRPKADVVVLKMNSGNAWFADESVNGTKFKFLKDTGARKSVMSMKCFKSIPELFRPQFDNTNMIFQIAKGEVLPSMCLAYVTICVYGYTFNLPIFVCDMGDIDCIFGLDAGMVAGFIISNRTCILWFNSNQHEEPKQLSRAIVMQSAICHLRAVQRVGLKLSKACTIEVAYAKRAMSRKWNGSKVFCTTHSNLWSDLGAIMMDGIADMSSGSVELDFVNSTSHLDVIKPGQIVATSI